MPMEHNIIDAMSGWDKVDKKLEAALALISNMATNSQQFNTRFEAPRKINEVTIPTILNQKITDLTAIVKLLAVNQMTTIDVCSTIDHSFNLCPTLPIGNLE